MPTKAEIDAALTPKPLTQRQRRTHLAILGFLAVKHESEAEKRQRFQAAARRKRFGRKV